MKKTRTVKSFAPCWPVVLALLLTGCGPPRESVRDGLSVPEPEVTDLLLVGAPGRARALLAELPTDSAEGRYAEAQLVLYDGDHSRAVELLSSLETEAAAYQLLRLQITGTAPLRPEELPPPGDDVYLELGRGLALLNADWREEGLERLLPLDDGPSGCLAQLRLSAEFDPVLEKDEHRRALLRAWELAGPPLRHLVFPAYKAHLERMGGGRGTALELLRERDAAEPGTPLWNDLTYWTALLSGEDQRRRLAWELLEAGGESVADRRRAFELLAYSADVPAGERWRQVALALELGELEAAAAELGKLPAGPGTTLLRGELERALGRYGLALAQYETLYATAYAGLANLYAGLAQFDRNQRAAAVERWGLVAGDAVPATLRGTYLEDDAARAVAKAAFYRANQLRYTNPGRAAELYTFALERGLAGQERARAGWRLAMIQTAAGRYADAARAMEATAHDPAYTAHAEYWSRRLAALVNDGAIPTDPNGAFPFYELPGREDDWWLYDYDGAEPRPWGGLLAGCYSAPSDPELDLLLRLASVADDKLFSDYLQALSRYRDDDPLFHAVAALAWTRRRLEAGDYRPAPGLIPAGRAVAFSDPSHPGRLLALPFAYPLVYLEELEAACSTDGPDPLLLLALTREESRFNPRAVSRVGALGLTQQMPGTAAMMAAELGLTDYDPLDPGDSLLFGAAYLRRMLRRYNGNLMLALAGYNAGPGNADRWVAAFDEMPPDLWLLTVPFDETRRYITRVLGSYRRYRQLYGG